MWGNYKKIKIELSIVASLDILLLVIFLVTIYYLWHMKIPELKNLDSQVVSLNLEEKASASIIQSVEDEKLQSSKLDSYFVSKDNIVNFIEDLDSLAKQANVVLNINSPTEGSQSLASAFNFIRFDLEASGSFSSILYFFRLVEAMPYKIIIDHMSFALSSAVWSGDISFKLESYSN